jgi:hypothetical protein
VAIRRTVGKVEKSNGRSKNKTVIKIMTENVMDKANDISNNHVGIGKIKTVMMATIPSASKMSPRKTEDLKFANVRFIPDACGSAIGYSLREKA